MSRREKQKYYAEACKMFSCRPRCRRKCSSRRRRRSCARRRRRRSSARRRRRSSCRRVQSPETPSTTICVGSGRRTATGR
ncbi:unnamed protein product [Callosobruchus maculatus]|uniref:Uncharacterized protein n=1 Tax=Callosobruchus maculatus TaxID=64391 RepID=A0A653DFT1_CALMS|nr:unnamed protein product [Callosobruchus maculatus]